MSGQSRAFDSQGLPKRSLGRGPRRHRLRKTYGPFRRDHRIAARYRARGWGERQPAMRERTRVQAALSPEAARQHTVSVSVSRGHGLATIDQFVPFHCSAKAAAPLCRTESDSPTAKQ